MSKQNRLSLSKCFEMYDLYVCNKVYEFILIFFSFHKLQFSHKIFSLYMLGSYTKLSYSLHLQYRDNLQTFTPNQTFTYSSFNT